MPAFLKPGTPKKPGDFGSTPTQGIVQGAISEAASFFSGKGTPKSNKGDGNQHNKGGGSSQDPKDGKPGQTKTNDDPPKTKSAKAPDETPNPSQGGGEENGGSSTTAAEAAPTQSPVNTENPQPSDTGPSGGRTDTEPTAPPIGPTDTTVNPPDIGAKPTDGANTRPDPTTPEPVNTITRTEIPPYSSAADNDPTISLSPPAQTSGSTTPTPTPILTLGSLVSPSNSISTASGTGTETSTPTPEISDATTTATSAAAHASSNAAALPTYAIPLITLAALMALAFLAALAVFGLRERKRKALGGVAGRGEKAVSSSAAEGGGGVVGGGGGGGGEGGEGKRPSYLRAVGKAAAVATGVSGLLWAARKLRERGEGGKRERERKYFEEVVAYAKIGGEREEREHEREHEEGGEKEFEVEVAGGRVVGGTGAGEASDRGRERERRNDAASQRSESVVVMSAALGYTPAPAPALISVASPVRRSPSVVSSLSSSTRSQGQYERLVPSPVTDETPYVWTPPAVPSINQAGPDVGNRGAVTGTEEAGERRQSDIPAVLRPGGC